MWKKKNNYEVLNFNIYSIKPQKHNWSLIYIIIVATIILVGSILITKNCIKSIHTNNEQKKQLAELQTKQEKIVETQDIEKQNTKLPQLTEIGIQNIEQIYNSDTKRVFLTFDDGPSQNTVQLLDVLKQENIKAGFFMLGNFVEMRPDIVKRAYEEGHYIANHGYSHVYSSIYSSPEAVLEEYNKCNEAVQKAIGIADYNSHLFRFPGGLNGGKYAQIKQDAKKILNENNIVNIDWNALTGDSEKKEPTKEFLMDRLKSTTDGKNSVVLLMHDSPSKTITIEVLPEVIAYLREQGYEFQDFYDIIK